MSDRLYFTFFLAALSSSASLTWSLPSLADGLLISTMTNEETGAIQISIGSFFPMLLLSGILWPLESIPTGLRYFAYILPTTWSAEAMRSLMLRGWGMDHMQVGEPLYEKLLLTFVCGSYPPCNLHHRH